MVKYLFFVVLVLCISKKIMSHNFIKYSKIIRSSLVMSNKQSKPVKIAVMIIDHGSRRNEANEMLNEVRIFWT